jgi:hypothetical protein
MTSARPAIRGGEPGAVPAVGRGTFLDSGGQRVGLLAVVPAGPAQQGRVVAVGAGVGVGDEALLEDVELRADVDVVSVARLLAGPDADLADVLATIIADEHVPYLANCDTGTPG